jgi:hypothetical protein
VHLGPCTLVGFGKSKSQLPKSTVENSRHTRNPCAGHFERYGDLSPINAFLPIILVLHFV